VQHGVDVAHGRWLQPGCGLGVVQVLNKFGTQVTEFNLTERWDDMNANLTLVLLISDGLEILSFHRAVQPAMQIFRERDVLDLEG
jgi:hypothetical protein